MTNLSKPDRIGSQHTVKEELQGILIFMGVIWTVYVLQFVLPVQQYGVHPRSVSGLIGIITMPFLHGSIGHIVANSIPLLILLALLAGSRANSAVIVASISVLTGALLWAFSLQPNSNHIGASGLVYGLISYLTVSGFLERRFAPLLVSIIVLLMFGLSTSTWLGMLPTEPGVSWDGHLYGAIAGVVVAYLSMPPSRSVTT